MVKIGPSFYRRRSETPQSLSTPAPLKRALLIGINYTHADPKSDYPLLRRAQDDTKDFRALLISKYEYLPENIVMMLDNESVGVALQPTRANILGQIRKLVDGAQSGSRFVFFYSGHSGQVEVEEQDPNKQEEDDGFDEFIVPVDHHEIRLHLTQDETGRVPYRREMEKRMIIDNKLRKILVEPLQVGAHLTAIFDSCHSGTLLDLDHYLCNNIYNPRTIQGYRRYKTLWQGVHRKDGQRMSQADVKVITRKHAHPDSNGGPSSPLNREGSSCNIRIYQRRRVSETEMEVTDTSVGVSDINDGKQRQFSVQSRHASIQVGRAPSLARVRENGVLGLSIDSLAEGSGVLGGERCASPVSLRSCNGFCDPEENPLRSATVLSISSCQDAQRTWESKKSSFTQWLIAILRREPHQPIGGFIRDLTDKMYEHAQKTHEWSKKRKESWKRKHPASEDSSTLADSDSETQLEADASARDQLHPLDLYDYGDVPAPQLGGQCRLDLEQPMNL
ncbi:peptidase C14 [Ganoderma leucocontextum]|nr:peptidase C14 [Ganoderma leucocontextum]